MNCSEYSDDTATMVVERLDKYHVVHLKSGASLPLMRKIRRLYKDKHLFAVLPTDSRVNRIAALFGELVLENAGMNIYHIKGD